MLGMRLCQRFFESQSGSPHEITSPETHIFPFRHDVLHRPVFNAGIYPYGFGTHPTRLVLSHIKQHFWKAPAPVFVWNSNAMKDRIRPGVAPQTRKSFIFFIEIGYGHISRRPAFIFENIPDAIVYVTQQYIGRGIISFAPPISYGIMGILHTTFLALSPRRRFSKSPLWYKGCSIMFQGVFNKHLHTYRYYLSGSRSGSFLDIYKQAISMTHFLQI